MRWKRGWILLVPLAIALVLVFETKTTEPPREQERTLRWSADPKSPGGNLPVRGRSLFDRLIGDEPVPFPFSALVEKIARHSPNPKIALLPLGRSLQRTASAPDFFAFPRFIVAADTDPVATGITLKDRLFLGYNEKAAIIEVLSYNDDAARFEFQIVKDYRDSAQPKVFYANRAVCVSCHQNAGPIFPRPLWDETNANLQLASKLAEARRDFHGVSAQSGVDTPNAIDDATDRANLLSLYQILWREGCEDGACRAGLLLDLLRYRLSGRLDAETWALNWQARWPEGIAIANPDLPNRNPLLETRPHEIPADMEALNPREPLEVWNAGSGAERALAGMSEMIPAREITRLDDWLSRQPAALKSYESACEFTRGAGSLDFKCNGDFALEGRAHLEKNRVSKGRVERLVVGREELRDLQLSAGSFDKLKVRRGDLRARLEDGSAVQQLSLSWKDSQTERFQGKATIVVRDELPILRDAVTPLAEKISSKGVSRASGVLFASLGLSHIENENKPLTPIALDTVPGVLATESGAMQSFQRWCANCHRSNDRFPPNFLTGDAATVENKITHCAERIYVRLAMHDVPVGRRAKTPMPPESARDGLTAAELNALRDHVSSAVIAQRGRLSALDELLHDGYENLRACLPQGRF